MCNKLCAFGHNALDRRKCNTQGRSSTRFVDHTNAPTTVNEFLFCQSTGLVCLRRDMTTSASAAQNVGEPIN